MIRGSRIGRHPVLQGREDGYVAPGRRAYSERAKRSHSHGFQIIEDPTGNFTGFWFSTAEISDCLRYPPRYEPDCAYPDTLRWLQGVRVKWLGQMQTKFTVPKYGLIYGRTIYATDSEGELLLDGNGNPIALLSASNGRDK